MLKQMLRRYVFLCQILATFLWLGGPALGAWPVIDVKNLVQSVQQVQQTVKMINQQKQQIQHELQMLTQGNQLISLDNQMLAKFTHNYLGQISSMLQSLDTLIQSTSGLTYDLGQLSSAFESSYRPNFASLSDAQLMAKREDLATLLMDTVKQSMTIQSQVTQNLGANKFQLENLVSSSQSAPGQTAAIQAGNQILAQLGGQLVEIQALLASQSRATEAALAHQLAEEERARELGRRNMVRTPHPTIAVGDPFPSSY